MKKFLLGLCLSAAALFGYSEAQAQNVVEKGSNHFTLTVGGSFINESNRLGLKGNFEHGILDNLFDSKSALTVGGMLGYSTGKNLNYFAIAPGAALHYHFIPNLDTYVGLFVGYENLSSTVISTVGEKLKVKSSAGGFYYDFTLGARYHFSPTFGAALELGGRFTNVAVGFTCKF